MVVEQPSLHGFSHRTCGLRRPDFWFWLSCNPFIRYDSGMKIRCTLLALLGLPLLALALLSPHGDETGTYAQPGEIWEQAQVRQVCFVLDTTGSMGGLLEGAKKKIWSIAHDLVTEQPQMRLQFGLVAYRDVDDDYVTRVFPLTDDLDEFYANLHDLNAAGGGDTPESVNQALAEALSKMQWLPRGRAVRTIFLVGDAPPHMDYEQDTPYELTCTKARKEGLVIHTIQCGDMRQTVAPWREIAQMGGGSYKRLPQEGNMQQQVTPYDERLYFLQLEINRTVINYGTREEQAKLSRKLGMFERMGSATVASRAGYMKATESEAAVMGGGDLVTDMAEGRVSAPAVAQSAQLPPELRELSEDELEREIAQRQAKRSQLQQELKELSAKRDTYLRDNPQDTRDSFDREVIELLLGQTY